MRESDLKIQVKLKVEKKSVKIPLPRHKLCNRVCTSFSSLFYAFRYIENEFLLPQMFLIFVNLTMWHQRLLTFLIIPL